MTRKILTGKITNKTLSIICLLLTSLMVVGPTLGHENLVTLDRDFINLAPYIDYYVDANGGKDIHSILQEAERLDWAHQGRKNPSFGFTPDTYWYRFAIGNQLSASEHWILEVGYSLLDFVDIYIVDEDNIQTTYRLGDKQPFRQRIIQSAQFAVPLEVITKKQ